MRQVAFKICPTLVVPSLGWITPSLGRTSLSANRFLNKQACNVPNIIPRNPPFCFCALFLIASLVYS